ncbi:HNH endonuclease [Rhodococcus pyridinivorans]|uniref:HNH endonuclease n=1 Tax=Rhodococcus pyridinivorans TaxID=103816 RepID=UPI00280BDD1C|nr:HNH endonuclease [Rhodococcus pyridinivorans]WMM74441.1 HNH endonuclease [Rhodococcus pyridinivorans]
MSNFERNIPDYLEKVPKPRRRVTNDGAILLYEPQHPAAIKGGSTDGYVLEHRKVAWDAGLLTDLSQTVAHINGDRSDNRIENLRVRGQLRPSTRGFCSECGIHTQAKGGVCLPCKRALAEAEHERQKALVDQALKTVDPDLKRVIEGILGLRVHVYKKPAMRKEIADLVIKQKLTAREEELVALRGELANAGPKVLAAIDGRIKCIRDTREIKL